MKHRFMMLFIALFFAIGSSSAFAQAFETVSPGEAGFSSERLERLSELLNSYSEQQRISGGVALVLRDGKAVFFESFGKRDVEADDDMPKDAIFRIASQTKAIVSVGVMMLQEEGRLLINDPVSKYLPEFAKTKVAVRNDDGGYDVVDSKRQITIRDLLMHTAGIGYGWGVAADQWKEAGIQGWYFADRDEPIRETVRRIAALPMDAHPGEHFVYGYATDILGALLEEISGMKLDVFLSQKILQPLKMHDTHFYLPKEKIDRLATVYSSTPERGIVRAADPGGSVGQGHYVNGPRMSFSGGAGFLSTATDYGRFLQMLLNGGELDGVRILSPKSVELMTINHLHDIKFRNGEGMGLGFDVLIDVGSRGTPGSLGDYGWGGAYHSTYWVSPKDRIVVVFFTQLLPATGSDIHGKLRTMIYQAMME
ncbi:MAG TPA: serine hydrolase [Bacteroidetes bacterium]|nr:serine hydrolase [Bacteroidota bacterium]